MDAIDGALGFMGSSFSKRNSIRGSSFGRGSTFGGSQGGMNSSFKSKGSDFGDSEMSELEQSDAEDKKIEMKKLLDILEKNQEVVLEKLEAQEEEIKAIRTEQKEEDTRNKAER